MNTKGAKIISLRAVAAACLSMFLNVPISAGQIVVPFGNLSVIAGPAFIDAQGTWGVTSDAPGNYAKLNYDPGINNFAAMACYPKERTCFESLGWVDGDGYLRSQLIRYEVTKWTAKELKAESALECETIELSFVFGSKEAIEIVWNGGLSPANGCAQRPDKLQSPMVMKLMSPDGAAKYAREKRK